MTKTRLTVALLAGGWTALGASGCSSSDEAIIIEEARPTSMGSARLSLTVGDNTVDSVTAVISGERGFVTQTHTIDVSGSEGVVSIFFGSLPVGGGYEIELSAGACNGSAGFAVELDTTTLVPVTLICDSGQAESTGSVQVTGTIIGGGSGPACHLVTKIVAAPSIQNGRGPTPVIELFLEDGVTPTNIVWSTVSPNGGSGTFYGYSSDTDSNVTFDCGANGTVHIVADVTGFRDDETCSEQARAVVECVNQGATGPVCGNGIVEGSEQCDGTSGVSVCPAGTSGSVTCTSACARDTSGCLAAVSCGNGALDAGEQCDGAAGVGVCPVGTTGSVTCTSACARDTSGCVSGGVGACGQCALDNCALQRADVNANLAAVDPIIDCVLGANWEAGERASLASCANSDLLTCYCGSISGQDCANTAPSALEGQCVDEVLAGTNCSVSSCVAPVFLNPANANGKAMQYIQCQQDFCYDVCFNP